MMVMPAALKNSPIDFGRAAPPETAKRRLPPSFSCSLAKTRRCASAYCAFRSGPGVLPSACRAATFLPVSTAQWKIFCFVGEPSSTDLAMRL